MTTPDRTVRVALTVRMLPWPDRTKPCRFVAELWSRTSTLMYKSTPKDTDTDARALAARYLARNPQYQVAP